jgi:hypothetical protein
MPAALTHAPGNWIPIEHGPSDSWHLLVHQCPTEYSTRPLGIGNVRTLEATEPDLKWTANDMLAILSLTITEARTRCSRDIAFHDIRNVEIRKTIYPGLPNIGSYLPSTTSSCSTSSLGLLRRLGLCRRILGLSLLLR